MYKSFAGILFAIPVMTQSDCGSCNGGSGGDPDPVDTDVTDTDTGVLPGPCDGYVGLATEAEIAATPLGDTTTELLALSMDRSFTADPAIYARLVADLGQIRARYPDLSGIAYWSFDDGRSLLISADPATLQAMADGTYADWECPNEFYELQSTTLHSSFIELTFEGIYDLDALSEVYAAMPGVQTAEPNARIGDGPTVCATIDGETYHYIFDDASGDCQAGCINHAFTYLTTAADGSVTYQAYWDTQVGTPPPSWLSTWGACL